MVGYDDYDPWGYILPGRSLATGTSTVSGAAKNKFTGKVGAQRRSGSCRKWDDELGLRWYHFPARPYDPEIGRFLAVDPLAYIDPGWSTYSYVRNNPLNLIDPKGTTWYQIAEEYDAEEEYIDENGQKQTRTVKKTRYRWKWVDDGRNTLVLTSSEIVASNTNKEGVVDWAAVENAEGSSVYNLEDNYYLVITGVSQLGVAVAGGEGGVISVVDIASGNVYEYLYWAGGVGPSATMVGGMIGFEFGVVGTRKHPSQLGGWFWGISGFAAAGLGGSFSVTFSFGSLDDGMVTFGPAAGAGAGVSAQAGKMYFNKRYNLKSVPNPFRF